MKERVVQFGDDRSLVGVLTPSTGVAAVPTGRAVVLLNSGVLHRVGPNRLHVVLARELARRGLTGFRIDLSGVGDSETHSGNLAIPERWVAETRAAMDYLAENHGVKEFMLFGNCSGAAVAWLTAVEDRRVSGTALINLQGPRIYLRYYLRLALTSRVFWRRLRKGKARYREAMEEVRQSGEPQGVSRRAESPGTSAYDIDRAIETLKERQTRLLLVYCGWDPGLDHFNIVLRPKLEAAIPKASLDLHLIPGMNHDFSLLSGQARLCDIVQSWATENAAAPGSE